MGESKKSDFSYAENEDKGLQAFSQIFAMKDRQIVKWQRIAYTGMACVALSVLCITYIGTKSTFIPYVIHVDEETGYVQSLGALTQKKIGRAHV